MKYFNETFRIVLADDDLDDCSLFREALERVCSNFMLEVVYNGSQLLELLSGREENLPHLVFLDLNMPLMGGKEALEAIRKDKDLHDLSVVILSTSSRSEDKEETLVLGANGYISKPSCFERMQEILRKVLEVNWQYECGGLDRSHYVMIL